jgi:hypothetical protein
VAKLLWCGNSPDLNVIEPCWFWLKREITKKGVPTGRAEAIRVWLEAWKNLPIERVQAWIERIPFHIREVIRLEGGNEYNEGRPIRYDRPNSHWVDNRGKPVDTAHPDWEFVKEKKMNNTGS